MYTKHLNFNHFFIKVFDELKYAQNFINSGEMHFSEFSYLRDSADIDTINGERYYRGDPNEGLLKKVKNEMEISGETYSTITTIFQNKFKSVYSMFSYDVENLTNSKIVFEDEKLITYEVDFMPEKMKSFGKYAVLITNSKTFMKMIEEKLDGKIDADFVKYIPKFDLNVEYNIFTKISVEFDYQNEFRIVDKDLELDENNNIKIGNLNTIAELFDIDKLSKISITYEKF